MSNVHDQPLAHIEGDYYEGAFGPSILLVLTTRESVAWLRQLFDNLAAAPVGTVVSLIDQPQVRIGAALTALLLSRVSLRPTKHLVREIDDRFVWSCTAEEWETASLMLEPFLEQSGHQYLTSEGEDDALVEISFGEDHG